MPVIFTDGPAAGFQVQDMRTPILLRVVRNRDTGAFDTLDQLDDTPVPEEEIFLYVRASGVTAGFWDGRDPKTGRRTGGRFVNCEYRPWPGLVVEGATMPAAPDDATMRDRDLWERWCAANETLIRKGLVRYE